MVILSDVLVTYAQHNKNDSYNLLTESRKRDVQSITSNFIQELVTKKGSNVFDKEYGTLFIDNLGSQINVHKVNYFLKAEVDGMRKKYGIVDVSVSKAWLSTGTGMLNIEINVRFSDTAVDAFVDMRFDGSFTEQDIIEYS